jgi:hypothetical protein
MTTRALTAGRPDDKTERKYPFATLIVAILAMVTGLAAFGVAAYSLYYTIHGQDYPKLPTLRGNDWTCAGYCAPEDDSIEIVSPNAPLVKLSNGKKDSTTSLGLYDERTGIIEILGSPPTTPGGVPTKGWQGTGHVSHDGKFIVWTDKGGAANNGTAWTRKTGAMPASAASGS